MASRPVLQNTHAASAPVTYRQLLRDTTARFEQAHIDSPSATARSVLSRAANRPREWLVAHDDELPEPDMLALAQQLIERVLAHEPMAYILGDREFYGLPFVVDARVLIPRPETEMLVEAALTHLRTCATADKTDVELIDVGTGSGAVAIAVAAHMPNVRVAATDVSAEALDVARLNAQRNGAADRIQFIHADLLGEVPLRAQVITANLPYVTVEEIEALPPEIQAHEPRVALDGGSDGLALVRRLLNELNEHLAPGGMAVFEIGASQGSAALQAARDALPGWRISLEKDLAKLDRMLQVIKPNAD